MQHLEVSGAVRPIKWSLGVKWLMTPVSTMEGDLAHLNVTTQYEESSTELDSGVCNALHTG